MLGDGDNDIVMIVIVIVIVMYMWKFFVCFNASAVRLTPHKTPRSPLGLHFDRDVR